MKQINMHEAKTHLSSLVEKAVKGEDFIIARAGRPLVIVTSYIQKKRSRVGFLKGQISIPDDFDNMGREKIEAMFEGRL